MPTSLGLRRLPQVHRLATALPHQIPAVWRVQAAQMTVDHAREAIREKPVQAETVLGHLQAEAERLAFRLWQPHLEPVINATGVILHTNLGRAPLGAAVLEQIRSVAEGYSTLEFDLASGLRGSRHSHVDTLLVSVTGAEAGMVVNNNAAAVLLSLSELASGRSVIVSRGQLVEIGGAFRIPDVMAASGAHLVEVGATNKTRLSDYRKAIDDKTGLLLKVHASNFRQIGFVESVETHDLVALGREFHIPVMEDLGSGVLFPLTVEGFREPSVAEVVAAGADLVTFSGDKLLGGPQAGLIVGREDLVARMKRHPLARALRVDKMTLAGMEMTLRLYREGRTEEIPLWRMLNASPEALRARAANLARRLRQRLAGRVNPVTIGWRSERAPVGGGSLPGLEMPTAVVLLQSVGIKPGQLEEKLRTGSPPVVARIMDNAVVLDVRTIAPSDERRLLDAVVHALHGDDPSSSMGHERQGG